MINDWKQHELYMSFEGMTPHPSDIDLFVLKGNTLIIGEIKNERGTFKDGQRALLAKLVDGWKYKAILIYIVHKNYVQNGDTQVDVANCEVKEYYYKGKWRKPREYTTVKMVVENFK